MKLFLNVCFQLIASHNKFFFQKINHYVHCFTKRKNGYAFPGFLNF